MSGNNVKISVIMPVYRVEDYVGKAIESIQAQTLSEWELFAVDDIEDETFAKVENLPDWTQEEAEDALEGILSDMMDYAYELGIMKENSIVYKDLFDTKIMGCLLARPSEVRKTFRDLYNKTSAQAATDYFYKLSCDSN